MPRGDSPAAIAAASPPLEPLGVRPSIHGFSVRPKTRLSVSNQKTNSGTFVWPRNIPPACLSQATAVASWAGTWSSKSMDPLVVLTPSASNESLAVKGTPWSGPHRPPRMTASSASRALSIAASTSVTTALSLELRASIRSKWALMTSTGDRVLLRMPSASSVALR